MRDGSQDAGRISTDGALEGRLLDNGVCVDVRLDSLGRWSTEQSHGWELGKSAEPCEQKLWMG